jgi:hypothetical protein
LGRNLQQFRPTLAAKTLQVKSRFKYIVLVAPLVLGGAYLLDYWWKMRPTEINLERAARSALEYRGGMLHLANPYGDLEKPACLPLPWNPMPDARSRKERVMGWHMDFLPGDPGSEDRQQQLQKLDALNAVGLLRKRLDTNRIDGELKQVSRYTMTNQGWRAASYERAYRSKLPCFTLGKPRFLAMTGHQRRNAAGGQYQVATLIGFGSEDELEPWARDERVQAAFPQIKAYLKGRKASVTLVRAWDGWINPNELRDRQRRADQLEVLFDLIGYTSDERYMKHPERVSKQRAYPAPTEEEARVIIEDRHIDDAVFLKWQPDCISLPGGSEFPVDENRSSHLRYAVSVFMKKNREPNDRVAAITIPYLELLERAGILTRKVKENFLEVADGDSDFDIHTFRLAPQYRDSIDKAHPSCLTLGKPSIEITDLDIVEDTPAGLPFSHFRYKLKLHYRSPPNWMRDTALRATWTELDHALVQGKACRGELKFDRETREASGDSSCWWAFDSLGGG